MVTDINSQNEMKLIVKSDNFFTEERYFNISFSKE